MNQVKTGETAVNRLSKIKSEKVSLCNSDRLFNLTCSLYRDERLDDKLMHPLKTLFPDCCQLFIINENEFIYPERSSLISAADIWGVARIDMSGIFRRKITVSENGHEYEAVLYTIHMGENINGREIAAGILQKSHARHKSDCEHRLYGFLGSLKRCYSEFSNSSVLKNFIRNKSALQYVVNAATDEIIVTTLPPNGKLVFDPEIGSIRMFDKLIAQIVETEDDRGNINIANCTLMGNSYSVVSINQPRRKENTGTVTERMAENILAEIRENIQIIRDATGHLDLRMGQFVDEGHISLIDTIHSSAGRLNKLIYQTDRYKDNSNPNELSDDINKTIASILSEKDINSGSDMSPGLDPGEEITAKGKLAGVEE